MSKGDIKWWFEPGNGQKWGWMTPENLKHILAEVYGSKTPGQKFAAEIGVSNSTVSRWGSGTVPMPMLPAHYLHLKHRVLTTIEQVPALSAPWLPKCRSANGVAHGDASSVVVDEAP